MLLGTLLYTILCCEVGYANKHPACIGSEQHEFESHILELNSEESGGQVENVCTLCGYIYKEYLPATGHRYGDWIVLEERAESVVRIEQRECLECHREEIRTVRTKLSSTNSDSIKEKKHVINQMDFVLSTAVGGVWAGTLAALWYNSLVLNWYKRERAKGFKNAKKR